MLLRTVYGESVAHEMCGTLPVETDEHPGTSAPQSANLVVNSFSAPGSSGNPVGSARAPPSSVPSPIVISTEASPVSSPEPSGVRTVSTRPSIPITRRAVIAMCNAIAHWYQPDGPVTQDELVERYVLPALTVVEYRPRAARCPVRA